MSEGRDAAFAALAAGDVERLANLLRADPALTAVRGENGATLLHAAAERDDVGSTDVLLAHGAEVDARASWGQTPLEWAANLGSSGVAAMLRSQGAAGAPLWTAAALGDLAEVERSFEGGAPLPDVGRAPIPGADLSGWPEDSAFRRGDAVSDAFYIACRRGHLDVARFLRERGADVNASGYFGAYAIHWAAMEGQEDVVHWLVEAGARTSDRDPRFDATPAGWAHEGGHEELATWLEGVSR